MIIASAATKFCSIDGAWLPNKHSLKFFVFFHGSVPNQYPTNSNKITPTLRGMPNQIWKSLLNKPNKSLFDASHSVGHCSDPQKGYHHVTCLKCTRISHVQTRQFVHGFWQLWFGCKQANCVHTDTPISGYLREHQQSQ